MGILKNDHKTMETFFDTKVSTGFLVRFTEKICSSPFNGAVLNQSEPVLNIGFPI
jgi:hypothetical protein